MTTVFLSGSRQLTKLNDAIKTRINNIVKQGFRIFVGDANGADKAMQSYLADVGYPDVTVFCSGKNCRNNIGNWHVKRVLADSKLKGRDFFAVKDREMASEADYGFVMWDGESAGSISNILELLKYGKQVAVYFSPEKDFKTISDLKDVKELLQKCNPPALEVLRKKIKLDKSFEEVQNAAQKHLTLS